MARLGIELADFAAAALHLAPALVELLDREFVEGTSGCAIDAAPFADLYPRDQIEHQPP